MVIDTSAIIALLRLEAPAAQIRDAIDAAPRCFISGLTVYETRIVLLGRAAPEVMGQFDLLLLQAEIAIEPFDAEQAFLAYRAYEKYGKGMGHPAQLSMGDCAAYALAKSMDLPLLYVGGDFARTDITSAL
jgi:ribonuclease VapC